MTTPIFSLPSRLITSQTMTVVLSWRGRLASSTALSRPSTHSFGVGDQREVCRMVPAESVSRPSLAMIRRSPASSWKDLLGQSISAISSPVIALMSMLRDRPCSASTSMPCAFMRSR